MWGAFWLWLLRWGAWVSCISLPSQNWLEGQLLGHVQVPLLRSHIFTKHPPTPMLPVHAGVAALVSTPTSLLNLLAIRSLCSLGCARALQDVWHFSQDVTTAKATRHHQPLGYDNPKGLQTLTGNPWERRATLLSWDPRSAKYGLWTSSFRVS